jgi:hypothetical protein
MFLHPVTALTLAREHQRQRFIAAHDARVLRHLRSGRRGP